jgi:hypothetical protein
MTQEQEDKLDKLGFGWKRAVDQYETEFYLRKDKTDGVFVKLSIFDFTKRNDTERIVIAVSKGDIIISRNNVDFDIIESVKDELLKDLQYLCK